MAQKPFHVYLKGKGETDKIANTRKKRIVQLKKLWKCESLSHVVRKIVDMF